MDVGNKIHPSNGMATGIPTRHPAACHFIWKSQRGHSKLRSWNGRGVGRIPGPQAPNIIKICSHMAVWYDNTSTISWVNKLCSSRLMVAAHLVQALATQLHVHQGSPLVTWLVAGIKNIMADTASRLFNRTNVMGETFTITDDKFL